ncbi:MAG: PEGA domain-containing protein [Anaeromyxobacter sp.]|nr:PEGA domain-containing protein [Anaeromyxobacter sp.]MBL0275182.1 PEGA domain-containing protein [Anaeromyxobacter sp.]
MKTILLAAALLAAAPSLAPAQEKLAEPAAPASTPAPARAAARPPMPHRLAALDFALAGSAHPDLARVLADAAAAGAAAAGGHQVLSQGEIAAMLGLERTRQMLGCTEDQGCQADLASALDSDRLLAGSLTILDRTSLLTVRLIDVKRSRTLARTTATLLDASEQELVDGARRLAHEAITGKRLDTTGVLRIAVDRPGATITLDGKALGSSPLTAAPRVLEGPHAITVQKAGFVRWSSTVVVTAGQTVPVEVDLIPIQLLGEAARSRLWTWGFVSAGVAGAATISAVYFGVQSRRSHDDYQAATSRSVAVDLADQTRSQAMLANVSWGVAGVAALGGGWLLYSAMVEDARAARPPDAAAPGARASAAVEEGVEVSAGAAPVPGGGLLTVGGRF